MNTATPTPTEPSPFAAPPSAPQPAPPPPAHGTRAKLVPLLLAAAMGWGGSFLFSHVHRSTPATESKTEATTSPAGTKAAPTKEAPKTMTTAKQEPPTTTPATTAASSTKPVASSATAPANPIATAAVVPQTPPPLPPSLEPAGSVPARPVVQSTPLPGGSTAPQLVTVGVTSPVPAPPAVDERALARDMFKKNLDTLRILGK